MQRWVQMGAAGSVAFDLASRPGGAGTARVLTADGSVLSSPTPTLDAVNTTLSATAAAGATSVSVTSATGVTAGRRYLLGGAEGAGGERVLVASVSGTTVTLARPLAAARASGATFQSARVSVAVSTDCTAAAARQHRVEWTNPDTSEVEAFPFDVTAYAPRTGLASAELLDADPLLRGRLPKGTWLPALMDRAWSIVLTDLAGTTRHPGGYAGVVELTEAHAYLVRALAAETDTTPEGILYRDDMRQRYAQERDRVLASVAYDAAGTGAAAVGAGQRLRGLMLERG